MVTSRRVCGPHSLAGIEAASVIGPRRQDFREHSTVRRLRLVELIMNAQKTKGMSAREFMATFSAAGREERMPRPEPPGLPETVTVDRYVNGKWISKTYAWDGSTYSIEVANA